jgi:hypothetical protein
LAGHFMMRFCHGPPATRSLADSPAQNERIVESIRFLAVTTDPQGQIHTFNAGR